ncbi:hypothetical protein [Flavobacterium granuli]|uniref:LTXXQ motif family protein n=1 Tax=Flavobacterium granuli TaxID=280093 RepID=A0A1M5N951_9FLAO|nr:hypothetical protein [Flavobacterium granuli]PRZ25220.1 hypothetical protein BC624_103306 [Flavobacterium granuli]SHG85533.1 hypothetical protein SAMN05443373_104306 [Flavobacterium granuli]
MKKLIIAALLVVGMTTFAQDKKERPKRAQMEKMTPEQRQEKQLQRMTTELGLNAKQQEQMKQLLAEQATKREAMMEKREASREEMKKQREASRDKMEKQRETMENKMKAILTPEQLAKWKSNQEKMRERAGDRMKERMHDKMQDDMEN